MSEVNRIRARYDRRLALPDGIYDPWNPWVYMAAQEKERVLVKWIRRARLVPPTNVRLLEVGCGSGVNLMQFLRLGFRPENLAGIELLEARAAAARGSLPQTVEIATGDATETSFANASFDVVFQSTVFTSIGDPGFRHKLARTMWRLAKPGGGVLWYDFIYDNPRNPDVTGIPLGEIKKLFPGAHLWMRRVTLAPPISRRVARIHPSLYTVFNAIPWLRTHVLCWLAKPADDTGVASE